MTTLEYMEKQIKKHRINHERESARHAPEEVLKNIKAKINHYETAVEALTTPSDSVAVVRCADCKHWDNDSDLPGCTNEFNGLVCGRADDFCSYGEQKDGDGNG